MRQKLLKFLYISIMLFAISCQYDTESSTPTQAQPEKKFTVKKLKFDEISKIENLNDKLKKINKGKKIESNINGKIVYSTENDFYIDTNIATYIEDENGKISYTFKVFRNDSPHLLENIILTDNDSLGFDIYFAQYNITQQEFNQLKNGEAVNTSEKTMVFKITDNSLANNIFNKTIMVDEGSGSCIISQSFVAGELCGCDHHVYGAFCTCPIQATPDQWITTWGTCPTENGGDGGGGNGSTGDPNDPIPDTCTRCDDVSTTPVLEEPFNPETPCDELKKLTKNPSYPANPYMDSQDKRIRTAITNMKYEISTSAEAGYAFINPNNFETHGPFANYIPPDSDSNHVNFGINHRMYGTIHTHPTDRYIPMFSHDDIYTLLTIAQNYSMNNTSGNDLFVCVLSVEIGSSSYIYAIKISDITKLNKLRDLHYNANGTKTKWERFGDKLEKKYRDHANGTNGNTSQYEKTFLQFIEDQDLGVSLYEMEQINAGTPDVKENWKKLELDGNNPLKEIPCN